MTSIINSASSAAYAATSYLGTAIRNVGNLAGRIVTTLSNFVPSQVSTKVQRLFSPISRACSALPKPIKVAAIVAGGIASVVALKRFYNMKSTNQNNAEKDLNAVASAVAPNVALENQHVELSDVEKDAAGSGSAQNASLVNKDVVLDGSEVEEADRANLDPVIEEKDGE